MKKICLLPAFVFMMATSAFSQLKHDYVWTIGYSYISSGGSFGGIIMDFKVSPPSFTPQNYVVDEPHATISDKNGQLLAYTDGCRVINRNHQVMLNGDTLNPGEIFDIFCGETSYPLWQPTIFLPKPGSDSLYYLFHLRCANWDWNPINLMYTIIDAFGDGGNGAVVTKNNAVLSDSLFLGNYVTATRHANGRDWWIVTPRIYSNNIHVALLSPEGVEYRGMQDFDSLQLGIDSAFCCSRTAFSADGNKYFRNSPKSLLMFDFDRCTGLLSNPLRLDWDSLPFGGAGVAVSPNSHFLYLTSGGTVQQYDLRVPDLAASMQVVAVYDGTLAPEPATFFQMMPGPDGKIYINSTSDNKILHVIHSPNELGLACKVEQHAIRLPSHTSIFMPNFPNYRLGPIDGSTCDTLGIDNLPIAHFRWDVEDTLSPQQIEFTDLSYYEPTTWLWDFGDGTTSQDTSPVHLYASPGTYAVCLTVCNANACDTVCHVVEIKAVGAVTLQGEAGAVLLWPNPAGETLYLKADKKIERVHIKDATGREVLQQTVFGMASQVPIDIRRIPSGLYYLSIYADSKMWTGKFIKL